MKRLIFALISFMFTGIVAWHVTWLGSSQAQAMQQGRTYSTNADFAEGLLVGVESTTVANQLQLSTEGGIPPYIWVPNQNEGSISKIDTRDGMEKARYRTGGGSSNPSRTTVDLQGNAWVANRNFATVVKIALAETDCEDRNGNGVIETSRDANNDGNITGAELLDWGKDECVLKETVLAAGKEGTYTPGAFTNYSSYGDEGARALTIDGSGNVWAGIHRDRKYFNISSANGAILGAAISTATEGHNPYGAVVDRYGNLWSAAYPNAHVVKINLATRAVSKIAVPHVTYGLGLDKNDHLFVSSTEAKLSRLNVATGQVERTITPTSWGRGVVVTDDGDVWVANSGTGKLDRWANDLLSQKIAIDVGGAEPAGVAIDQLGKVWVTAKYSGTIRRINPATNAVDLTKAVDSTSGHYGYSDMTGKVARTVTTRTGTWTVIYDSGVAGTTWGTLRWNGNEPAGTSIRARIRSSANQQNWSNWEQATNGTAFSAIPANRYLQIEVTLQLTTGTTSPVLYDLTVSPGSGSGGACTYSVTPMTQTFSGAGGTGMLNVATQTGCSWSAHSNISWITVNTGLSGEGSGTVSYTVAANTSVRMRAGGIAVAGRYVAIVQSDCQVTALTVPQTVNGALSTTDCRSMVDDNAYADLYSFSGQAGQRVAISLTSPNFDSYLTLYGPNGGLLSFNDDDVSSDARIPRGSDFLILPFSGTYLIDASSYGANETGNYTLSLTTTSEGSNCTYTVTPTSATFNAAGGAGAINVSTQSGCPWTADSTMGWLTIDAGASGRGSGVVNYTVAANLSQGFMLGRLYVAGQFVPIVESGTGGNCPVTPLAIPQTVNNSWSVGDCVNGSGEFTDLYSITATAGQQVSIAMTTANSLTTLILWGPTGRLVSGYMGDGNKRIPPGTGYFVLPYNGTYLIEVASGNQGSYILSLNAPSIVPPACPTISNFTPANGAVGNTVTITGSNFTDVAAVRFANNVSAQFTVASPTQITATVPSGAVTGVITLSKANCADVQTSSAFTVTTSSVAELIDHAITGGPIPGSCVAPAAKSNFAPTDERAYQWSSFVNVKVGDVVRWEFVQPSGTVYDTQQRASEYSGASCFWAWITIAGQQAANLPGDWQVRVFYNGTQILTERYRILTSSSGCPTVTASNAAAGAIGSTVTLTGTNFTGITAVKFTNNVNAQFTVNSDTSLTAVVPVGAVTGPITLSKPNCADTVTTVFIVTGGGGPCTVKADYQLQNTLSSSVGTPPALTNLGSNTFGTVTVDGASRTVLSFGAGDGVVLTPTTSVIANQVYTAVVLFSFSDISGYRRILDFKNNAEDSGLYNRDGLLVFFSGITGPTAVIPANTFVQVVLTRDAAKNVVGYVNGVQQFSFVDSGDAAVIDSNNKLIFFRDNPNNEVSAGAVARIRLYDCALTPSEVAGLDRVPGQTPTCPIITGLNVNRLCNPGAELGQGATVKSQVVPLPGWTTTSNFTALRYDTTGALTVEEAQQIGGGANHFYGGDVNAVSTATQLVNVADESTGIDAGQRTAQFQAYLGGFGGDNAGIRAEFLNAGGTVLGTALVLGPRSDDMQLLSTTGPVPTGTRTIRVTMTATRVAGDDNEGYFDNLSLVLTQSGTTACPTITNLSPSSSAVGSIVTITGTNFTGVTAVRFANNVTAQFTVNSATQITATVPNGAVTGVITLSKTGCTDVQTVPFTVTTAGPCIDVVIASNLTASTGTTLTVPITVSDTTGKGAIAYDATLTYDPAVLRLQNPPTDKTGTLSSNYTITTNIPAAGQLRISGFGSTALTGAGVLLNVKFDVLGVANACSNLSLTSFRFNEGTPCSTTTNGRACVTGGGIISGAVSYCITPKPVPGTAVNVTGSSTTSATTNTSGNYTLPNLNSGNYTLTPAKTGDVNGLASFDAALVAQHVVGINTLNSCQQLAGDTSNNGELSSFDAALIAQYVVGINNAASIAGTWKFVPPTRTYTNLSSNQTNQNFDAVLVGDVSGNWTAGATAFDELARASSPAQQVSISLPNLSATTGASVTIPITVGDLTGKGVIAYDFDLAFDQNVLQTQLTAFDAANTLSSALTITANPQPGRLRVSAFGTQPLTGAGVLLNLKFNVLGAGGTSSALTWQRFLLNETVQTNLTNGRISVGYAVACVSAASFVGTALASESIVAGFGQGMATRTEVATIVPLPTSLAGTTVRVRDSAGIERLAPLFFVSSGQVNYQVPPGTAAGAATIVVNSGDGAVSTGTMQIARVMPGLFAANSNGMGVAAAVALRVKTDGSQVYEVVASYDMAQQRFVPLPLSLGPEGEQLYLILFGTGVRNFSSLANVQARVGGTETPVAFVGAVEGLVGLDQLNVGPLPRSLAGSGEVNIAVQVDGQIANTVRVSFR